MNSSFTFPPRAPPTMRPEITPPGNAGQQQSASSDAPSRDSNLVRASILDAALDLGYGSNSTVAKWMFENPLEEEDEEVSAVHTRPIIVSSADLLFLLHPTFVPLSCFARCATCLPQAGAHVC